MKQLARYFIGVVVLAIALAVVGIFYLRYRHPAVHKLIPRAEKIIKIPEGWTNQDIASYLEKIGPWASLDFLQVAGSVQVNLTSKNSATSTDFSQEFSFLAGRPSGASLEGYLFPDTYRIYASSTITEIINKMLVNFDEKLTPKMRADIKNQGKNIYDILIMASIIEKEAPINYQSNDNHDAKIISGIFWHRLQIGQALQSDATLSYIFHDNQTQHSGPELSSDSPYNTYKYNGLPPGPICNPGLLAIEAAIYPTLSSYNYFLTVPGKRVVIYATTYSEHLKNKAQYLQ